MSGASRLSALFSFTLLRPPTSTLFPYTTLSDLFDRFFVNAEASPDGHNWSTAAFSNDYIDKAFRWNYSRRGRTYDFEGVNRLPSHDPPANQPPVALPSVFNLPATETDVANYLKRFVP